MMSTCVGGLRVDVFEGEHVLVFVIFLAGISPRRMRQKRQLESVMGDLSG